MRIRMEQPEDAGFMMTPMIDMVFLLLVFFMCASQLSQVQSIPLEIPTATEAVVPKERPDRFVVNITRDGRIYGGTDEMTMDELRKTIREYKEAIPDIKVYLRADQETEHGEVRKVMNAMAEEGVSDFIFGAFIPSEAHAARSGAAGGNP